MAANQRPDRDELTARLRKFGISDALCDRVHDEGVEAVFKAPKGPKKKDPVARALEDEAAKNVQPKHRKSALDALSRPKMARGLLESYSGTDPTEFRYWKGVELKRRSAKETAKRASNESWTLKKRKELRAWKAERDALARRCKETKGRDGEEDEGLQTGDGQVRGGKGRGGPQRAPAVGVAQAEAKRVGPVSVRVNVKPLFRDDDKLYSFLEA